MVDALEVPFVLVRLWIWKEPRGRAHLVVGVLHLIHEIQTSMYDKWVHMPSFLTEACDAIAALFRGAKFMLEEGLVVGAYYAEIVGHPDGYRETRTGFVQRPDELISFSPSVSAEAQPVHVVAARAKRGSSAIAEGCELKIEALPCAHNSNASSHR